MSACNAGHRFSCAPFNAGDRRAGGGRLLQRRRRPAALPALHPRGRCSARLRRVLRARRGRPRWRSRPSTDAAQAQPWLVEWAPARRFGGTACPGDQGLGAPRGVRGARPLPEQPFLEDLHLVLEAPPRSGAVVTMGAGLARRLKVGCAEPSIKGRPTTPKGYPAPIPTPYQLNYPILGGDARRPWQQRAQPVRAARLHVRGAPPTHR